MAMNKVGRNDPCACGSGKKFKHCCLLGKSASSTSQPAKANPPPDFQNIRQQGLAFHQAGRFIEAESRYRQFLDHHPDDAETLHLLGVLALQTGQPHRAVDLISQAIRFRPADADYYGNLAVAHKALNRPREAIACIRKTIELKPDQASAYCNLGNILESQGLHDEAIASYRQAIGYKADYPEAHFHLGIIFNAQGNLGEAIASFRQAAHYKAQDGEIHFNLGKALHDGNMVREAVCSFQRAIAIDANRPEFWIAFSMGLRDLPTQHVDVVDQSLLSIALKIRCVDPNNLLRIALASILLDPLVDSLLALANDEPGRDRALQLLHQGELTPLFEFPLLLAVLEECLVPEYRLERLLTLLRRTLLASVAQCEGEGMGQAAERFAASLATLCFNTDYAFSATAEEAEWVSALEERTKDGIASRQAVPPSWLMLLAAYKALHRLKFAEAVQAMDLPLEQCRAVIKQQLLDPWEEDRIREQIPHLTPVAQNSRAVQLQYEENPYPRWNRISGTGQVGPLTTVLRQLLPCQDIPDDNIGQPQILVAGCGTGRHPALVAQRFVNARILAVDLSLPSLAYAMRKMGEQGIVGIDYRQADILELGSLDKRFDVIECCGVLHHLRDPFAGWRILTALLRPQGYMHIALYSRRARTDVEAGRRFIAERGFAATPADMRQCRQEILSGLAGGVAGRCGERLDFYNLSTFRDLLFHVQEHLISPREIQAVLDRLGLRFLGFEFPNQEPIQWYRARFPDNPACDVLENWETVEIEHPKLFNDMYHFWVKKIGTPDSSRPN